MPRIPTAIVAAAGLILGYAVAVVSGSRPLGGLVLLAAGLWCVRRWWRDHGARTAVTLGLVGLFAFVTSHVLALAIGAWAAVLVVSAAAALVIWRRADAIPAARQVQPGPDTALGPHPAPTRATP